VLYAGEAASRLGRETLQRALAHHRTGFPTYPSCVTLLKQKSKATFKTLTGIRFVALFSNMMDIIVINARASYLGFPDDVPLRSGVIELEKRMAALEASVQCQ